VCDWLGTPVSETVAEMTLGTPMPGIRPVTVLAELRQHGFCALDVYGVVRFQGLPAGAGASAASTVRYFEDRGR
jgi:hypothetical protein